MKSRAFAISLGLALPLLAQTKTFMVDANHTVLGFKASTLLFDVPGRFTTYHADIQGDPVNLGSVSVRIEINAKSINTDIQGRDEHLRSPDFFDVAKYPKILFTSDKAWRDGEKVVVHGTLTLHGVSKEMDIPFVPAQGLNGAGAPTWSYRASLPLNRLDFGLGAESVAAKISLKNQVELDLLLVGFFEAPTLNNAASGNKKSLSK